jgi:starvation-inducible DNA-binding protein
MRSNPKKIRNPELQAPTRTDISLQDNARQEVLKMLNVILADEAVLSMKTRNAHWNVRGPGFAEWHKLFNIQFLQLNKVFDEVSKYTYLLGSLPTGSLEEFLQRTRLNELPEKGPYFMDLAITQEAVIQSLREDAKKCLGIYKDKTTSDFLLQILDQHKKMVAALRSEFDHVQNHSEMNSEVS